MDTNGLSSSTGAVRLRGLRSTANGVGVSPLHCAAGVVQSADSRLTQSATQSWSLEGDPFVSWMHFDQACCEQCRFAAFLPYLDARSPLPDCLARLSPTLLTQGGHVLTECCRSLRNSSCFSSPCFPDSVTVSCCRDQTQVSCLLPKCSIAELACLSVLKSVILWPELAADL